MTDIGDIDGDDRADFIAGAPGFDGAAGADAGKLYAFSGVDASEIFTLEGEAANDGFANNCSDVPDVDGDAVDDVAVSAEGHDGPAGTDSGKVYLISGATGTVIRTIDGPAASGFFGRDVSGISDVDGDGVGDVVVGGIDLAQVRSGADGSVIHSWTGGRATFGWSVSRAGDVNGDSIEDVVVGDPGEGGPILQISAYAKVFSGASGAELEYLYVYDVNLRSGQLGWAVADAGDVNGDARGDVLIGAPGYSNFASTPGGGAAFVFSVPASLF